MACLCFTLSYPSRLAVFLSCKPSVFGFLACLTLSCKEFQGSWTLKAKLLFLASLLWSATVLLISISFESTPSYTLSCLLHGPEAFLVDLVVSVHDPENSDHVGLIQLLLDHQSLLGPTSPYYSLALLAQQ